MKKRLASTLLALALCLSLLPIAALAEEGETPTTESGVTTEAALKSAVEQGGTVTLGSDITLADALTISGGKTVTLDLNGYVLQYKNDQNKNSVIIVQNSSNLTIKSTDITTPHHFAPNCDGLWVLDANGSETVTGGIITGGTGHMYNVGSSAYPNYIYLGGGVYVAPGGELNMEGGSIVGCTAENFGGGVALKAENRGPAGKFFMTGGSIIGCTTGGCGGGVSCYDNGNIFNMSGSTAVIRDCRAANGGGAYVWSTFHMENSTVIRNCIAEGWNSCGGGVYVNSSSEFIMSDNTIIENCKTIAGENSWKSCGGGVYVSNASTFAMKGDTMIQKCSAENLSDSSLAYGGGVATRVGVFTITDSAKIQDCSASNGSVSIDNRDASGVYAILYADGGEIKGDVTIVDSNPPGKITGTEGASGTTKFNGKVTNNGGIIEKGNFADEVINGGTISGGTFSGTLTNETGGKITGGTFPGTVINNGGELSPSLCWKVKFVTNSDSTIKEQLVIKGQKAMRPGDPTKDGYIFDDWYVDNENTRVYDFNQPVTADLTLTAKWTANQYAITYDLDGGTVEGNPTSYTVEAEEITLKEPTKSGYIFTGWSGTGLVDENNMTVTIPKGSTGDREYTAHWRYRSSSGSSSPSYAITIPNQPAHGIVTISPTNAKRGSTVTITVKPDSGYVLETLAVVDGSGNEQKLTDLGEGRYTFTMPSGKVEVKATFQEDNSVLNVFYDVPNDAYYFEAVKWAVGKGITNGVSENLFGPDRDCTRAQIVTFLWRAVGSPVVNYVMDLTDVPADAYYAEAVRWALSEGITTGTGAGTFSPDAACTRAQAVTFLARALDGRTEGAANFQDVPAGSYYAEAVAWALETGVTNGISETLFGPDQTCTRGQIVTFLFRADAGK